MASATPAATPTGGYLLAGRASEYERLRLQSLVWEPAGRAGLAQLPRPPRPAALDCGCGMLGWLRVLAEWAGPDGRVVGTDIDAGMLAGARAFVDEAGLGHVTVQRDDLFASALPSQAFDLVHARFQICPLGRAEAQMATYLRVLKPGGWLVLEDPDGSSWHLNPHGEAHATLVGWIRAGFAAGGGEFDAGRGLPALMRAHGLEPEVSAHVVALPPGHPYLRLPLQFATSLRPRLVALHGEAALDELLARVELELQRPATWGTTFTLVQARARRPG